MTSAEIVGQLIPDSLESSYFNFPYYFEQYGHIADMKLCSKATIGSVQGPVVLSLALTILHRGLVHAPFLPRSIVNLLLIVLGYFSLIIWVENPLIVKPALIGAIVMPIFIKYASFKYSGYGITALCLAFIVGLEYKMKPSEFASSRGCLMILGMKLSSLAFDVSDASPRQKKKYDLLTMVSYLISPATITFGPFITYETHVQSLLPKQWKAELLSAVRSIFLVALCSFCLVYSSCVTDLLFPASGIVRDYATAQSFRVSHYFICLLAQAFAELSGLSPAAVTTVNPLAIEFPRSLVQVVVGWNVPMHKYLRIYVYEEAQRWGPAVAVAFTFIISSLFHGLNFQLSAVLLSLGFYCYAENKLRNKIARKLDACVRARPCIRCRHTNNSKTAIAVAVNAAFFVLNVYHLIYLGMVFDGSGAETGYSWQHTVRIWKGHNFASHVAAIATLLTSFVPFK